MYYHVLIKTEETDELYEYDISSLEDVKSNIIIPYLGNSQFQFDGYFIEPSKVKRLVITETSNTADECVKLAYTRIRGTGIVMIIEKSTCVFIDKDYHKDITRPVLQEVKKLLDTFEIISSEEIKKGEIQNPKIHQTIFLAYSYRKEDEEFVLGFKQLLEKTGYTVIDGKADDFGSISKAIIDKIATVDIVVIVMTQRDKKCNGNFTTSAWLLEEKGAALALEKVVALFVEDGIDAADIGALQGDDKRFHFTRNNFLGIAMNFLRVLENHTTAK